MATIMSAHGAGAENGRRCDATCHKATKPACSCICGGRYHGKGSSAAAQEQLSKDVLGAYWIERDWAARLLALHEQRPELSRSQAAYELWLGRA